MITAYGTAAISSAVSSAVLDLTRGFLSMATVMYLLNDCHLNCSHHTSSTLTICIGQINSGILCVTGPFETAIPAPQLHGVQPYEYTQPPKVVPLVHLRHARHLTSHIKDKREAL